MNINNITVGKGLGDIKFGCTRDELKKLIGEPSETDTYNASGEEDGFLTESWHFDEQEFSVSFDEEDNWRLTTIAVSSPNFKFNGIQLIDLSINEVLTVLEDENLGDNELEDLSDENTNHKLISFISSSLNLWFEDDNLSEIQWSVLWENEDTPILPK